MLIVLSKTNISEYNVWLCVYKYKDYSVWAAEKTFNQYTAALIHGNFILDEFIFSPGTIQNPTQLRIIKINYFVQTKKAHVRPRH